MAKLIAIAGRITALLGIGVCAGAGISRIAGAYQMLGFETVTLFIVGIALMLAACLAKLYEGDFS